MSKPRETFHFRPPVQVKEDWISGLVDLEVYNSVFNITEKNNKIELFTDTFDEFSFKELKEELEEFLVIPNITDDHLEDETIAPRILSVCTKLQTEKRMTDGCFILFMGYNRSPTRDFESYLRIVIGLHEDDFQLILKDYNEKFITHELSPGIYTIKDISEAVYTIDDHEETLKIDYDDISMKKKTYFDWFRDFKI